MPLRDARAHSPRVAGRLTALGVEVGDRVAGIGMTAAVVGVLRIGAAYVPIDVAYPEERQRYIFDNSGARVLIALPGDSGIGGVPCVAITIDGELDGEPACSVRVAPGAPAYVIYTSGSTGLPKGVVMTRRALANLIRWEIGTVRVPRPRTLQFSPLSFDVSFQEMLSTWVLGGTLVLVDEPVRPTPMLCGALSSSMRCRAFTCLTSRCNSWPMQRAAGTERYRRWPK
ncbi:AMP-binding enzyme family protein [Burkholderia pseudomallei MSHR2990]|nr:AMP-binding enzyme family protein [Burkholderia pseudomallei MSHR2990]